MDLRGRLTWEQAVEAEEFDAGGFRAAGDS